MRTLCFILFQFGMFLSSATCGESTIYNDAKNYIPAVASKYAFGHICPISSTTALTAEHVSSRRLRFSEGYEKLPLIWSDEVGNVGTVGEINSDARLDLSLVQILDGPHFVRTFPLATEPPKQGETVYITGYDWDKGMEPKVIDTKVLRVTGRYVTYNKGAGPGSSGSCVLSTSGYVYAINTFELEGNVRNIGGGVGVWGELFPEKWAVK